MIFVFSVFVCFCVKQAEINTDLFKPKQNVHLMSSSSNPTKRFSNRNDALRCVKKIRRICPFVEN
tara:strand:- start:124 stop:318 length:195 start_codon:yes stop_codon:yes gene_type:complete